MSQFKCDFRVELIDSSGIRNLMDFDFRESKVPNIYVDVRSFIKTIFEECITDVRDLLPSSPLHIKVNIEQYKKINQSGVLACFDPDGSGDGRLAFRIYYDSIVEIGKGITESDLSHVTFQFKSTLYHELIHAADLVHLSEINRAQELDFKSVNYNYTGGFFEANSLPNEVNVQWALLNLFAKFRAEGIAIIGEKLLMNEFSELKWRKSEALQSFNLILNRVLEICSGLQFYNNFQSHDAVQELQQLGLSAYEFSDVLLIHALNKEEAIEGLVSPLAASQQDDIRKKNLIETIKEFINTDLSEFIQILLSSPELHFRERFLQVCAVIQREGDENAIQEFSRNMMWSGFNKDSGSFVGIIRAVMGSKIPLAEIIEMHDTFLRKSYPDDIMQDIKDMSTMLIHAAQNDGSEVAHWALTYLFDEEDMIHDDISFLGWQDDWVVLDSAMRILNLKK